MDRLEHDFGPVGQEQELETTFEYWNDGDTKIEDIRAIGDCGCYGVTLTHKELEPGQRGTVSLKFRTLMFNGNMNKTLKILSGKGVYNPIKIKLRVQVIAGVVVYPGRLWFGDVLTGSSPSLTTYVKWHAEAGKPFLVTGVEVPGHEFEIKKEPYSQGEWQGTAVTLGFKKPPKLGMFSATALIRTDHPDYPRISLPVTAYVTGKVWVQTRTIFFGWVHKGKAKRTQLLVKPFSDDVDLGRVRATSRNGQVNVSIEKHPTVKKGWRLLVEVPENAKEGCLDDVVVVHTSVPGEKETEIQVQGEVLVIQGRDG